jgi:YVTN family beta-propeller protein
VLACSAGLGCKRADDTTRTAEARTRKTTPGAAIGIAGESAAYVTNNGSDSLSVIDRNGDSVVSVAVDLEPDAHEAPHHLAIDSSSKGVFVALSFPPSAEPTTAKKDPHAGHGTARSAGLLARLDLATLAVHETREVDENPGDVVLTHDKQRVLVTHFDMKRAMDVAAQGGASPATMFAALAIFDAREMRKLAARPICVAPHGVVTTRDDRTAFVACYGSDELAVVDLSSAGFPVSRIPLGRTPGVPGVPSYGPYSVTISPDEATVIVANLEGQDVRVFDRTTKRFIAEKTIPLAAKAFMPAFVDAHTLLVPLQAPDGLARIDLDEARTTKRTSFSKDTCVRPHVVRAARDGRVYLVCEGDHRSSGSVLEIDPVNLDVRRRWAVGAYPDGIAFGDD